GYNLREVRKGPGSIAYGLELLNQYNIHITERSIEMLEEQKKYAYKKHKRGDRVGQLTNEPIDAYNHCWDGARYYAMEMLKPIRRMRKRRRATAA
ncbi:MAG: hypothetical protein AAFU03_05775, partial [Bacteroidota bacterium]